MKMSSVTLTTVKENILQIQGTKGDPNEREKNYLRKCHQRLQQQKSKTDHSFK